ncbi:MAG: biotin transporter BioY [Bacillota bacterium]
MKSTRNLILSGLFAAVVALLAQLSIPLPFSPVPLTGQIFGVFLAGSILGAHWSAVSLFVYVILGAVGLPVFHNFQGGLHIILGPTGGYLWGFVLGGYLLGRIGERGESILNMATGMLLCLLTVYTLGVLQLSFITGLALPQALLLGVLPFIPLDLVKLAAAAVLGIQVRRRLRGAGLIPAGKS